ncbi:TSUP family transporter [Thalassomonas sp. M1454]|uniref:TSUP family transporter n=1 Tax=Thalassomonas sp. M1454 TaxID=2594477 RepID=UPI00117FD509|nr:TSUP family transporter [Thalassomonas sp. M1454]TRX57237.1 TSUP family transporter [Thalassomonas sp. M1454]
MFELFSDPHLLITLSLVGFLAGFIDAIAGGGGLLTVPVLLTSGLPPHIALGTNKLSACFGSLTASITFYRKKLFNPIFWFLTAIATAVGALTGTIIVNIVSADALNKFLPLIILLCAVYTLFSKNSVSDSTALPKPGLLLRLKQSVQGFVLGFYDGFAGPGTGTFWTVSSLSLYKMNILLSSGLARSMNFISNSVSLLVFIVVGQVDFTLGLAMGLFMVLGSWIGAHSAIKYGSKFIRPIFISVVVIMAMKLAYNAWF